MLCPLQLKNKKLFLKWQVAFFFLTNYINAFRPAAQTVSLNLSGLNWNSNISYFENF